MAVWQILDTEQKPVSVYDDGAPYKPGDPEFSTAAAEQVAAVAGAGFGISYCGGSPGTAAE